MGKINWKSVWREGSRWIGNRLVIGLLFLLIMLHLNRAQNEVENLDIKVGNLIQERGYSWTEVNVVPDTIWFITFSGDTTWYEKITYSPDVITIQVIPPVRQ